MRTYDFTVLTNLAEMLAFWYIKFGGDKKKFIQNAKGASFSRMRRPTGPAIAQLIEAEPVSDGVTVGSPTGELLDRTGLALDEGKQRSTVHGGREVLASDQL